MNRLSDFLRQYNQENSLSLEQMAEKIDADVTTVSDWMYGRYSPSARSWKKLIKAFGEPIEDIMFEREV